MSIDKVEITAEVNNIQEMGKGTLPEPSLPSPPPGPGFGAVSDFWVFHLYLAEASFLFLRKDRVDVSGGPLDNKSCWPQTLREKPGLGVGQLAIWGEFVLINPFQPKEFLGLTLRSIYKYLSGWMRRKQVYIWTK